MKRIVVILVSAFMLWSCMKNDTPNLAYYEGAAIVKDFKPGKPLLEVWYDVMVVAPGLSGENLGNDDLLWVKLFIERDKQTSSDTTLVSGITYKKIENSTAQQENNTASASDFDFPINKALMWLNHAGNIWVFGFEQIAPQGQTFEYEMQFGIESGDSYPTVYLRSKKTNTVNGSNTNVFTNFGFDLMPLIEEYADEESNTLKFQVKYLSGFDADGKEVFNSFVQNPVVIRVLEKTENAAASNARSIK